MSTISTTIRLDDNVKRDFETVVNNLGMSMTTAITLFAKATIKHQGIPFAVTLDPFDDPVVRERIMQELKRRSARAKEPDAKHYTTEEIKKMLGI
ncbi:MAG: type II toxin-antitoxin system RelB/DinJ family antitoxin [Clostridia bacterium]|nr:type II toxin-antitoxin system RelB/DinJ family antitoxin [Clostridia bacterium]